MGRTSEEVGVMPKEITHDENYGKHDEYRQIEVRWSRNKYVEVATVDNLEPSTDGAINGIFLGLNRDGINRLIRSLRKARDQAFGADA